METRRYKNTKHDNDIEEKVDELFKKYKHGMTQQQFTNLRNNMNDNELVDKLQKEYLETESVITKRAKKLARVVKEKYGNLNMPYHFLLEKVLRFKRKYNLSDAVFSRFQEIYEQELIGSKSQDILLPATKIMNALGYVNVSYTPNNSKLSDTDYKCIQEIIKINAISKQLYTQVIIQSYNYNYVNAIGTAKYIPELGHSNTGSLIHPVIAGLFVTKNKVLDNHFLHSNLANIIERRYKNHPLENFSDLKLFNALIRDSNDIVCNSTSTYMDLLTRVKIQNNLWDVVVNLREGKIYNRPSYTNLLLELGNCSIISSGEQFLMFGNTDGIILRRLLGAFSYKPTVIYSLPYQMTSTTIAFDVNPYQMYLKPVVSNIPIIHIRATPDLSTMNVIKNIKLSDATNQKQLVIEHGKMVLKQTNVIYSNGLLFFYVDRRKTAVNHNLLNTFNPMSLNLPTSVIATYEKISDTITVEYEPTIEINNVLYNLKSVILAETFTLVDNKFKNEIMLNSSALLVIKDDNNDIKVKYDPIGLNNSQTANYNKPYLELDSTYSNSPDSEELFKTKGIIYMYEIDETIASYNINKQKGYLP